jgi:hypothetical protein
MRPWGRDEEGVVGGYRCAARSSPTAQGESGYVPSPRCFTDPISRAANPRDATAMLSGQTISAEADQLVIASAALERPGLDASVESLPGHLEALAEALRAAESALASCRGRVVPPAARSDDSVCCRYQRAAVMWPTDPPPSHERFAAALTRLDDAATATRRAAHRCDEARRTVEALLRTSQRAGAS